MIRSRKFTSMVLRQKLFATVLFLCFGVLAGFSPLLHNHDFDLSEAHQDCTGCQWSQSLTSLTTPALEPSVSSLSSPLRLTYFQLSSQKALFSLANRGPPFFF